MRRSLAAFTLAELLLAVAILSLIVLVASKMIDGAAKITSLATRRMDADSQVRPLFDRMSLDFAQMIKRLDVDYYVKSGVGPEAGNDKIAFFCNASGYYPATSYQSSLSLVAYRINSDSNSASFNRMERMGKGLLWNGASTSNAPIIFGLQAIVNNWPAATDSSATDADYELLGPQIFRFEYFYLLNTGAVSDQPGGYGMQDVSAIGIAVAAIDQKSRQLLSDSQIGSLIGSLKDFDATQPSYDLISGWQSALNNVTDMPRVAISGVRIYQRYFYLTPLK